MNDPWHSLAGTLGEVWQRYEAGVADRAAPGRHLVLATAAAHGSGAQGGEARLVVLRGADRALGLLRLHTDLRTAKVAELRAAPRATLLLWDAAAQVQVRARVTAQVLSGAAVADDWARVPEAPARLYGALPAPGLPVASPEDVTLAPDPAMFAVLVCTLVQIETLHLGRDRHRRALFQASDGWQGGWLAP